MKIIPQKGMVLCTLASSIEKETESGFVYKSNDIPLYKVESIGQSVSMSIVPGDILVVNATGTRAIADNVEYWLFKEENIAGKVVGK